MWYVNAAHGPGRGIGTPRLAGRWLRTVLTIVAIVIGIGFSLSGYLTFETHLEETEQSELNRRASEILPTFQSNFLQIESVVTEGSILAGPTLEHGAAGKAELVRELRAQLGTFMVGAAVLRTSTLEPVAKVGTVLYLGHETATEKAALRRGSRTGALMLVRRVQLPAGTLIGVAGGAGPGRPYGVYVELMIPLILQSLVAGDLQFSLYIRPDDGVEHLVYTTGDVPVSVSDRSITRDVTLPGVSLRAAVSTAQPLASRTARALPWAVFVLGLLLTGLIVYLVDAMRSARDAALRLVSEVEEKNAELDATERRYRTLVERLPLVTYTDRAAPGSPTLYVSPQVESLTGVSAADLVAEPELWWRLLHPDDRDRVLDEINHHIETGEPYRSEYRLLRSDGTTIWVHDVSVLDDVDGQSVISGYWEDVTDRKVLERKLQDAQRLEAVGRLAGGISHDFNNILNVISVSSDFLLDATPESDPRREDIEEIQRAANRAAGLTKQLVAFSRRQILRPELVDVNETVRSMDRMLSRIFGPEVRLETNLSDAECWVEVDPGQLEQVIVNLAVNARDAMPGGGLVALATEHTVLDDGSEGVALIVRDTGHGMDESIQERVFEPFFTTKEPDKGTGLGLASVYGIVQQSGGSVIVTSAPGAGATFRVLLPATRPAARVVAPPTLAEPQATGGVRILLVEDNDDVRRATTRILERFGHSVFVAADGVEALERLDEASVIEVVVTDVLMPRLGGIELVERLRADAPMLPVVFISGYPGPESDGTIVTDERTIFLQKPFGPGELADAVAELAAKLPPRDV